MMKKFRRPGIPAVQPLLGIADPVVPALDDDVRIHGEQGFEDLRCHTVTGVDGADAHVLLEPGVDVHVFPRG
jgi:hypothetical protein